MKKKYQILNIVTFAIGMLLFLFGLFKMAYYNSYKPLGVVDYVEINDYILCLISIIILFIVASIYHKKKKLKILTIIFYCISIIIFVLNTRYYIDKAVYFFSTDLWSPSNFDYFSYLFESIMSSLYTLYLIATLIYNIVTKYYKK